VAETALPGSSILCMLPDTGERYLSTPLFEQIAVEMTAEEVEISRSTPGYRFDLKPPPPPEVRQEMQTAETVQADASAFVDQVLSDPEYPLVLFALEWCEFCWSVRKLFGAIDAPFRSIDLDSVAYQANDWGGEIRRVLEQRTGAVTIPQVFIAGEHMGGATDVFQAFRDGHLQERLRRAGIAIRDVPGLDPYTLLPNWLHKR
jgi:cysteine synthase A